uniref:Uncharacterized protein n=1 Tax=Arundo donax TaxID=35708 RepID=A0A0A9H1X3_ARUDO
MDAISVTCQGYVYPIIDQ